MNNQIELYSRIANPIDAIDRIGEFFARSGMFGCEKIEQGKVLAMVCLSEQKSPTQILRRYHLIDGRLVDKALAVLAEFRARGGKHRWIKTGDEGASDEEREAVAEFRFDGEVMRVKFSFADAKRAELIRPRSAWSKQPAKMLRARVITDAVAMLCPEIFAGDTEPILSAPEPKPLSLIPQAPPTDEKIESEMALAPAVPPSQAPVPTAAIIDGASELPTETQEALIAAIGTENMAAATLWLTRQQPPWLTDGQTPANLSPKRAAQIIGKTEAFLRAVKGVAK